MRRTLAASALTLCLVLAFCGCVTIPKSGYVPVDEAGVMTVSLDDHDYDLAVSGIGNAMLSRLSKGYVVALGPVDTSDCKYDVQIRTLQKSLQVALGRKGDLKFMAAVDAMAGSSAAQEIYKIIEWKWFKNNPVDAEALQKFGSLADVNGILFGRVSCIERRSGAMREVTYRFVWELANTRSGVVDVAHEKKIRKNVR